LTSEGRSVYFWRKRGEDGEGSTIIGYDNKDELPSEWHEDLKTEGWELVAIPELAIIRAIEEHEADKRQIELFKAVWTKNV
jgi:hypothetical protein